jgi:NAD(P)H dehydrogenase (quinone)
MKILVILAHPDKKSFNYAISNTTCQILKELGHEVLFHDLYDEKFNSILSQTEIGQEILTDHEIQKHCDDITAAAGIIIIHPNWWGQPPAILKGWIDRVIRQGVAYKFLEGDKGEGIPIGLLKAESVMIFNTANTPEKREMDVFLDPLETLWKNCIFGLCGVAKFYRKMFRIIITSALEQRQQWLKEVKEKIEETFPKQ